MDSLPVDLGALTLEDLSEVVGKLGERPYRARQLFRWIHQRGAESFDEMTDLPRELRQRLSEQAAVRTLDRDAAQRSLDGTVKVRFRTRDGKLIESVYMPSADRRTLCVSTQAGCAMGCIFCLTATLGLERNLTPGEIVGQVNAVNREVRRDEGHEGWRPLTNLVFMGMGEPLNNFENLKAALAILRSEDGHNFSQRHITVSTVGLVPMIDRFAAETDVKLAISLNATTDEQRSRIMPVNRKWNLEALLEACRRFPLRQGRRITFEYVLMRGFNDSDEDARRLAELLRGIPAKVNLIPYNEAPELSFRSVAFERAEAFRELLSGLHLAAFVRKNRGRDIAAACGQLANRQGSGPAAQAAVP
ncbi:MAG: 23S rRNA (adenine(2503)-C(2))-methyltransferase RlmN [Myxococcales bacterium]|nr:23S rRNA (adenine(2503)-C(2))-methyltransferase RlmN [Myxococcales bacterium]